ncbi:hypothetical protein CBS101457_000227 [Exobasidium rhododendri]|nr:hypothetical protein CBS101457_000227 [Exobasidium rhododendri]
MTQMDRHDLTAAHPVPTRLVLDPPTSSVPLYSNLPEHSYSSTQYYPDPNTLPSLHPESLQQTYFSQPLPYQDHTNLYGQAYPYSYPNLPPWSASTTHSYDNPSDKYHHQDAPHASSSAVYGHPQEDSVHSSDLRLNATHEQPIWDSGVEASHSAPIVDLGFQWQNTEELCWEKLNSELQDTIVRTVNKVTCYNKNAIRETIKDKMTPILATALLSENRDLIMNAVEVLYRISRHDIHHEWKRLMTEDEAEVLVFELEVASGQEEEDIRTHLSVNRVSAELARYLLEATDEERQSYAANSGIMMDEDGVVRSPLVYRARDPSIIKDTDSKYHHWKKGTTVEQRLQIIEIVKEVFQCRPNWAYTMLNKEKVTEEDELGLDILRTMEREGPAATRAMIIRKTGIKPRAYVRRRAR